MKAELEYQSDAAYFEPRTGMVYQDDGLPIPDGSRVNICAWHGRSKALTVLLAGAGYDVNHSICDACNKQLLTTVPHEKQEA